MMIIDENKIISDYTDAELLTLAQNSATPGIILREVFSETEVRVGIYWECWANGHLRTHDSGLPDLSGSMPDKFTLDDINRSLATNPNSSVNVLAASINSTYNPDRHSINIDRMEHNLGVFFHSPIALPTLSNNPNFIEYISTKAVMTYLKNEKPTQQWINVLLASHPEKALIQQAADIVFGKKDWELDAIVVQSDTALYSPSAFAKYRQKYLQDHPAGSKNPAAGPSTLAS